jgi:hypothetical protein
MPDPEFLAVLDEVRALHERKSHDYGRDADPWGNIRAAEEFNIPPWLGAVLRANDKMARIKSFCQKGELKNESLEDSMIDIGNYMLIALVMYRRWRRNQDDAMQGTRVRVPGFSVDPAGEATPVPGEGVPLCDNGHVLWKTSLKADPSCRNLYRCSLCGNTYEIKDATTALPRCPRARAGGGRGA